MEEKTSQNLAANLKSRYLPDIWVTAISNSWIKLTLKKKICLIFSTNGAGNVGYTFAKKERPERKREREGGMKKRRKEKNFNP